MADARARDVTEPAAAAAAARAACGPRDCVAEHTGELQAELTRGEGACHSRDSIADIWGPRTPFDGQLAPWPERCDINIEEAPDRWVQSACILCSNGCACDIAVKGGKIVGVRGRVQDRVNKGRLGPKGLHGWQANNAPDRLQYPMIRKDGKLVRASWDEAMSLMVEKTRHVRDTYTSGAIAFYSTGQLMLEEYYSLAVLGKGGLRVHHMDGNTRLCTATAAASFRENFGCDGQPASYDDIDITHCLFMVGHNVAATQTVLWARILDRLRGSSPPTLIVVDPRITATAAEATLHLRPRLGTNLALLNGIQRLLIRNGHIDREWIDAHTVSYEELCTTVEPYTPERVEEITGIPAGQLVEAARLIGSTPSLVSTALQGVYQSHQATAAACAINNIHLLRGLIGKPGSGPLQMNGQPTAQNNRESGCNGEFTGFRNNDNINHMTDLAKHWNVDVDDIPHWFVPTHIMEIMKLAEAGSIRFLWIICTNPAVSLPGLERIRKILSKPGLFVVVQDCFLTETAALADIVLPAAMWGEKTGTFTNADRTVHIAHKAVDPPGECRSDFDIFLDYAARLDLRDKDGAPLIKWRTPEECFEAWKRATEGCACDYTGLSYAKLTGGSGIQWPCNADHPDGSPRLFTDGKFPTGMEDCETYGHDLVTGAPMSPLDYAKLRPEGRAIFKSAHYEPPHEAPDASYPFWLTTGRNVFHFHTRTKTARAARLRKAAPDAYVELHPDDAGRAGIEEGAMVRVTTRRGHVTMAAKVTKSVDVGTVFIPFHWGYFDADGRHRAANELTKPAWDPVSKQPYLKYAAAKVELATVGMAEGQTGIGRRVVETLSALVPGHDAASARPLGISAVSAAPAGGDVAASTARGATDWDTAKPAAGYHHMDPPAMAAPTAKRNAADVLTTTDPTARIFVGDQVHMLASQVQQLQAALAALREYQDEEEMQLAITTFENFHADMQAPLAALTSEFSDNVPAHAPSLAVLLRHEHNPRNPSLGALMNLQRLGAVVDAIGLAALSLEVAGKAMRHDDMLRHATSISAASTRIHRWVVGQLTAKAGQVLTVPV